METSELTVAWALWRAKALQLVSVGGCWKSSDSWTWVVPGARRTGRKGFRSGPGKESDLVRVEGKRKGGGHSDRSSGPSSRI